MRGAPWRETVIPGGSPQGGGGLLGGLEGWFPRFLFENGLSREIQFAETGQWVCVNTYVELSELPQAVRDFLNRRYPHMEMPSVLCRVETPARGVLYRVNLDLPHGLLELTLDVGGKLLDERIETYQN
ncbi:MAG: hypothetical protein IPJ00_02740 [Saprospirales bacterium]|nr:hypothetical protein [Saprospirales bacterium]